MVCIRTLFFSEVPTSEFLGSLVDVGMRGTGMGWVIQRWCEKRQPKGEWLLRINIFFMCFTLI